MAQEYCPKCRTSRNMIVTESINNTVNAKIITKSYHCEKCSTFVKSESEYLDTEGQPPQRPHLPRDPGKHSDTEEN